jgi:MFS family permease
MPSVASTAQTTVLPPRSRRRVLAILLGAGLTWSLSQTLILPALPSLAARYGADTAGISWMLTAYLIAASVATPLVGKLGDLHGRGLVLAWVAAAFCAGSLVCAFSTSLGLAIFGRVLQGVAGGVFPLAYGVIRDTFPPERVMGAIGLVSVSMGFGAAFGPPLAGFVVEYFDATAIFWLGMTGVLPAFFAPRLIHRVPGVARRRLDLPGAAVLSAVLVAALFAVTQGNAWGWTSGRILGLFAAGAALALLWVHIERRRTDPLIDLSLLRARPVALTNVAAVCIGCGTFASYVPLATYVQVPASSGYGLGLSVSEAGLILVPSGLAFIPFGPVAGTLCRRIGSRATLVLGGTISVGACAMFATHSSVWWLAAASGVFGIGQSLTLVAMANLIVAAMPKGDVGIGTGINTIMRTIGMACGTAMTASVLASATAAGSAFPTHGGYVAVFCLAGVWYVAAIAAGVAIGSSSSSGREERPEAGGRPPAPAPVPAPV